MVVVLAWQGLYRRSALLRSRWQVSRIAKSCLIWTIGFLALTLALKMEPSVSRIYMALAGCSTFLFLVAWRGVFGSILRMPANLARLRQRTIFLGWNDEAARLCTSLQDDAAQAFDIVGWVDVGTKGGKPATRSMPCLGGVENMEAILATSGATLVVAAELDSTSADMVSVANLCEREMVQFKVIPSCFRIFVSGLHLETIAGTPILGVDRLPLDSTFNVVLKRTVDIIGATIGLILSAPVIALFSALVYLESRGPVFYRQRRTGIIGAPFDIIKIRSMRLDAETATGARWCTEDDPRRLRIGAFMRKWNIDELPQFWNVLKGEMSLVGPRPERPELIASFKHQIPHYNARHHALPGMTGWAQVKGLRGNTDLGERIKCDLWYLENWSLMLDFQIIALTFFKRDNAY